MSTSTPTRPPPQSAWEPLRTPDFRAMWSAQFASNVGGWMQTVGAQWLMLSLTSSAAYLAFIQTAASLPVLLLAIPAGAVGDLVDRRRLLLGSELFMFAAALALGLLALAGLVTPWILLAAIFLVGAGQAWTSPTWQTLQPELVPEGERPRAIALGAVNMNLARAVGPALGGLLVAATQPSVVFLVNAATFVVVIVVVWRWRERRLLATAASAAGAATPGSAVTAAGAATATASPHPARPLPREHVREAMRASGRYIAASPALRTVLLRAALFVVFASAIWALLPAVAEQHLGLGSGGYGLLLGCVGAGAVGGATFLPRLRARWSADRILAAGSLAVGLTALVMATVHAAPVVAAALVLAGVGWIFVLATLSSGFQTMLPAWAKARGMAVYLVVFQGGMALGSLVVGLVAASAGIDAVLVAAAVGLVLAPLVALRAPFPAIAPSELRPAGEWPLPALAGDAPASGPVMVTIEYRAADGRADALLEALSHVRWARRRTGAISWRTWRDAAAPERVLEQFVVGSWDEHLRQHERFTTRDQARLDAVRALTDPATPPRVTHWAST